MRPNKFINFVRPEVGIGNKRTRERWLEAALRSIPSGGRILDAGAGTQAYRKFCDHLAYVSQDFGEYDGKGNTSGLQMGEFNYGSLNIVSDITAIPEPDRSFDAIMCIEVLEHVPNPIQAVHEFSRLLKPNGYLIITAPFSSLTHFAPYHFNTGFSRYWYEKHLADNDFKITEITANGNFFEFVAQEVYRIPSVATRFSRSGRHPLGLMGMYFVQRMLRRLSRQDSGSSELLCFGYQVIARKNA